MSSKKGRNRTSTAISDKRDADSKGSPKNSESESEKKQLPLIIEYETEDGLKVSIQPDEAEVSREYQLSENDYIELSAGIDWSPVDFNVEKKGLDLSVSGEVGVPGDLIGFSGGVTLDLGEGTISGGELGVELGGVEVSGSIEGEKGCKKSVGISFLGIGITYSRDDCNEDENTEPKPGEGSEDEAITKPGATMSVGDLVGKVPNSTCETIWFFTCGTYNYSYKLDKDGYRIGTTSYITSGISVGYLDESGTSIIDSSEYIYKDRTTKIYEGSRNLLSSKSSFITEGQYYNVTTDGRVGWHWQEYGGTIIPGSNDPNEQGWSGDSLKNFLAKGIFRFFATEEQCNITDIRSSRNRPRIPPSPPPERIMNDCCRESTKLMREIHQALAVRELLSNGVETPNRWIVAGGKKYTKNKTYLDLISFQMRMQDHLGIHPFRAEVTDTNAAQEGNQTVAVEFANATAALKQIAELLLENKGDSSTRLNLMIRTAVAVGQILNVVSIISKTIEGVVQYLGMPIRERVYKVKMPFDFTFGARKKNKSGQGFGKGTQGGVNNLDINTEEATEALLPVFMQDSEQPIVVEDFDDREGDLTDIIRGT